MRPGIQATRPGTIHRKLSGDATNHERGYQVVRLQNQRCHHAENVEHQQDTARKTQQMRAQTWHHGS